MGHKTSRKGQGRGQLALDRLRWTVDELATVTGQSARTVWRHIAAGKLQTVTASGRVYITYRAARRCYGSIDLWNNYTPPSWLPPEWRLGVPIEAFAALVGKSEREIRHQIDKERATPDPRGKLRTIRHGRRVLIAYEDVAAAVENRRRLSPPTMTQSFANASQAGTTGTDTGNR